MGFNVLVPFSLRPDEAFRCTICSKADGFSGGSTASMYKAGCLSLIVFVFFILGLEVIINPFIFLILPVLVAA